MRRTRHVWWKAAGLLLAATAASPALAQGVPGSMALPDDMPPRPLPTRPAATAARSDVLPDGGETLPAPRATVTPAPAVSAASPSCGTNCGAKDMGSSWQLWRAEKHAACQAHFWGYPAEFVAPPLGATIHTHFRTMVANGEAASMVLYHADFVYGSNALNLHGRDELTRIAALLQGCGAPIIIERTPEAPGLAEARRSAILNILAFNNIVIPPERVLIGPPIAIGLSGVDAQALNLLSLQNLRTQGQSLPVPASGSGVTGVTGGGIGGGTTGGTGVGTGGGTIGGY
jgi:hypothetical protein